MDGDGVRIYVSNGVYHTVFYRYRITRNSSPESHHFFFSKDLYRRKVS